ncbi:MAG: NBR1-Ig-like domain-containing protein [Fimbriimonadaceae bacterium]|nr:NBR1-Ig-like domain-containing protein [Fimbriimonadaceae bacterium]
MVRLRPGQSGPIFGALNGMRYTRNFRSDGATHVYAAGGASRVREVLLQLTRNPAVEHAYADAIWDRVPCQFVPDDPYIRSIETSPIAPTDESLYYGQSIPTFGSPFDHEFTGSRKGLMVYPYQLAILDNGFENAHPDLPLAGIGYDFIDLDDHPYTAGANHSAALMGIATARGRNGIGLCGVAPQGETLPLRVNTTTGPISRYVDAMRFLTDANMVVKLHGSVIATPWLSAPVARQALKDSTADLGAVHVLPSGNFGRSAQVDEMLTSRHALVVSGYDYQFSLGESRMRPTSAYGANVFCTAVAGFRADPLNFGDPEVERGPGTAESTAGGLGSGGRLLTRYTDRFEGTSAAAASVAGGLLTVQEALQSRSQYFSTRMLKHLIARNSDVINTEDATNPNGGWITNGAGLMFNANYGFGAPNWWNIIRQSYLFDGVTPDESVVYANSSTRAIPDAGTLTTTFVAATNRPIEEVSVRIMTDHARIGQLQIEVQSPAGTVAVLKPEDGGDATVGLNWNFLANTFWGENGNGTWTVRVIDTTAGQVGNLNAVQIELHQGQLVPRAAVSDAEFLRVSLREPQHRGAVTEATVVMRNTGTTTWRANQSFYLVSQAPYANNTWGRVNVTLAPTDAIEPGMLKAFRFNIIGPATVGSVPFQWQMRRGSAPQGNFGEMSPYRLVTVRDGNDAQFVTFQTPTTMRAGQRYNVRVVMRNIGTTTWRYSNSYYLVSQNPYANSTWGRVNVVLGNTEAIAPNQAKDFSFRVIAPNTRGNVNMQWRMREGGRENFGDFTPNVPVYVTPDDGLLVSETFDGEFFTGNTVNYTITIRNTGTSTWVRGQFDLLNLVPEAVTTWGWLSEPLEVGESIAPGQSKTFSIALRCPSTPGDYGFQTGLRHTSSNRLFVYGANRTFSVN